MRLVFSRPALDDLREIGHWIAHDNPARAATFVEELRSACRDLLVFPNAYSIDPRYLPLEIHRRAHGKYAIFYRVRHDRLTIVGIIHSARDSGAIFAARL